MAYRPQARTGSGEADSALERLRRGAPACGPLTGPFTAERRSGSARGAADQAAAGGVLEELAGACDGDLELRGLGGRLQGQLELRTGDGIGLLDEELLRLVVEREGAHRGAES